MATVQERVFCLHGFESEMINVVQKYHILGRKFSQFFVITEMQLMVKRARVCYGGPGSFSTL